MTKLKTTLLGGALPFWKKFGINAFVDPDTDTLLGIVPEGVVALVAVGSDQISMQSKALQRIGLPPGITTKVKENHRLVLYGSDPLLPPPMLQAHFGDSMRVHGPGDTVELPDGDFHNPENHVANISELSVLASVEEYQTATKEGSADDLPLQINGGTVLDRYSLLGKGAELEFAAAKNIPLLGNVVLAAQATVFYAPPNSCKTLITVFLICEAVPASRLFAAKTYYINADDSQLGLSEKTAILDEVGVHTLSPGSMGFTIGKLVVAMVEMVENDACEGVVIIVDTLKKFVDLMDKKGSASFADTVRQFVSKGGTFIALAHTRKNGNPDGSLVYGGTSDFMEDFDAACLLVPLKERSSKGEKLVQFQFKKRRGNNADEYYAYDDDAESSYGAKFASVRLVEDDEGDRYAEAHNQWSDVQIIKAIRHAIASGIVQKMALVKAVADKTGVSRRSAIQVLETYTGADPEIHHWFFAIRARGAKVYQVHPPREPQD